MHRTNTSISPFVLLLSFTLSLSACGYRLAGTADLPEQLSSIYLVTSDFNESQRKTLQRRLALAGATLVEQADAGAVKLSVHLKVFPDRQMATGAGSGANVKRITRELDFSVKSAEGKTIVPNSTLSQQKDVSLNDDHLLSSDREKEAVTRDLEKALFDQLIRQLILI
ncbi:MAG: hypothetical protein GY785_22085 [Gammaproteobacteria bacterium]|nr:hypothetical protein [Gammaproteobacteria bacterium]